MTQVVDAIYTNGHLEPLEQLALAEQERVTLIVQRREPADAESRENALNALLDGMAHSKFHSGGVLPHRDELHERR
jgi:predicted DNA-binding antitoxin AbrB/MazE fold protein